jgi:hypothetical protein
MVFKKYRIKDEGPFMHDTIVSNMKYNFIYPR